MQNLARLTKLEEFNCAWCFRLSDEGLSILGNFHRMRSLNISKTRVSQIFGKFLPGKLFYVCLLHMKTE